MLVQLGPKHEINLRGAPYELVPEYFADQYALWLVKNV